METFDIDSQYSEHRGALADVVPIIDAETLGFDTTFTSGFASFANLPRKEGMKAFYAT